MSFRGYISASLLKTIIEVAGSQGALRSSLLQALGLIEEELQSSDFRLSTEQVIILFKRIIELTCDQSFGLKVGLEIKPGSLNSLGYALMSAKNLEEALKIQKSFGGIISDSADLQIAFEDEMTIVSFTVEDNDLEAVRPLNDMFMSIIWNYSNWITRTEGKLKGLRFTHSEPSYKEDYLKIFGLKPEFDQSSCCFIFEKKHLKDPLYQADESLNALMMERSKIHLDKYKSKISIYAAVAYHIRRLLPLQKATLTFVADKLHMSERSLSRKLKEEGYSFTAVLVSVRQTLALEYLKDLELSVTEIAVSLGYRDYSSFSHAFRSWTGYSPSEFRESQEFG